MENQQEKGLFGLYLRGRIVFMILLLIGVVIALIVRSRSNSKPKA